MILHTVVMQAYHSHVWKALGNGTLGPPPPSEEEGGAQNGQGLIRPRRRSEESYRKYPNVWRPNAHHQDQSPSQRHLLQEKVPLVFLQRARQGPLLTQESAGRFASLQRSTPTQTARRLRPYS
mmetsp:Transcript_25049/g.49001  ORF Transcript_25049/g.49001 Transcript_25049/m.49001 type:complete len:123 (-) Transcript_25049:205-573(-)